MRVRLSWWMGLAMLGVHLAVPAAKAEERESGILTDRLSAKALRTWRSIENIVNARDDAGQPLHPKLRDLWQRIATGTHAVHIEIFLPTDISTYSAGGFEVEKCDPDGQKCTAVIRLCPSIIDGIVSSNDGRASGKFTRFQGLGKEERYAEVLGHELMHAVCMLGDPHYAALSKEFRRQGERLHLFLRLKGKSHEQAKQEFIERLRSLSDEVERPAEAVEAEIWSELRQGQSGRVGTRR